MSYESTVLIQELTSTGDSGRTLLLKGGGLPHMGAEWGMKATIVTTWYPGNGDEATQQILGPQELPSHWSGEWHRTVLGKTPCSFITTDGTQSDVVSPTDLRDILEDVARGGQRLRVDWIVNSDDTQSQIARTTREGRISELKFKVTRHTDIEWDVTFDWQSRGAPAAAKVTSVRSNTVVDDGQRLLQRLYQLKLAQAIRQLNNQAPIPLTLGQLEAFASYPTSIVNSLAAKVQQIGGDIAAVTDIASNLANQPVQIANRAVDLAADAVAQANSVYDTLSAVPYESQTTKSKVADFMRTAKSFGGTSDQVRQLAHEGQAFVGKLRANVQSYSTGNQDPRQLGNPNTVLAAYITKSGDTPQSVSQKFYKTPDHAVDILRANKLSWYTPTFTAGKVLIIPALPTQSATVGV